MESPLKFPPKPRSRGRFDAKISFGIFPLYSLNLTSISICSYYTLLRVCFRSRLGAIPLGLLFPLHARCVRHSYAFRSAQTLCALPTAALGALISTCFVLCSVFVLAALRCSALIPAAIPFVGCNASLAMCHLIPAYLAMCHLLLTRCQYFAGLWCPTYMYFCVL